MGRWRQGLVLPEGPTGASQPPQVPCLGVCLENGVGFQVSGAACEWPGPASPPLPRSSCGKPLTTWCARCSTASRRCSRALGPSRCVPLVPALAWVPQRLARLPQHGPRPEPGAAPTQRWLTESARLIARSGSAVEWITPLGIPIIQPYHRDCRYKVCAPHPAAPCPAVPPFLCWAE